MIIQPLKLTIEESGPPTPSSWAQIVAQPNTTGNHVEKEPTPPGLDNLEKPSKVKTTVVLPFKPKSSVPISRDENPINRIRKKIVKKTKPDLLFPKKPHRCKKHCKRNDKKEYEFENRYLPLFTEETQSPDNEITEDENTIETTKTSDEQVKLKSEAVKESFKTEINVTSPKCLQKINKLNFDSAFTTYITLKQSSVKSISKIKINLHIDSNKDVQEVAELLNKRIYDILNEESMIKKESSDDIDYIEKKLTGLAKKIVKLKLSIKNQIKTKH